MLIDIELEQLTKLATKKIDELTDKNELEQQLRRQMSEKYTENIEAIKHYLPDVYESFKNHQVNNLQITCSPSGVANIYDHDKESFLYSDDPISQCRKQVDEQIKSPHFTALSFEKDEAENDFIHTKYMNKLNNVFLNASEKLKPIEKMPDHLGSMIIFGIGLGYHLKHLLEDITIDHLYLCEPNNDWFYASLYTADWKYILETIDERDGSVYLYLGASYEDFTNDFIDNLKDKGSFNSVNAVLYQHYPSDNLEKLITSFSKDFHRCAIGWGFFDDGIISIAHDFANGVKQTPLLKGQGSLPKNLSGIPVFVIANGPSLDREIEVIKQHQNEAIIFSCGSALQSLLANNITPDFHVANERTKNTYHYLHQFTDGNILKKMNFLTTNIMHPDCTELFNWTGMALKPAEPSTIIAGDFIDRGKNFAPLMFSNPVVGNTGTSYACYMGFKEIYLFGLDFGYEDPKRHHSKDSLYYTKDEKEIESLGDQIRKGEIEVDGNFVDKVFSTTFFNVGRHCLESLLKRFDQVNCYNCSAGAKVQNAEALHSEHIMLAKASMNKDSLVEYIKNELFIDRKFCPDEYITWIDYDKFDYICDKLVAYLDKEFTSRAELATALKLQARYIFSYSQTRHRHIYFMLQGSITYVQSIFKMLMYSFDDEQASLEYTAEAIVVFKQFIEEAKLKYQHVLDGISEHETDFIKITKENLNR